MRTHLLDPRRSLPTASLRPVRSVCCAVSTVSACSRVAQGTGK
jgi:hypothetical protein